MQLLNTYHISLSHATYSGSRVFVALIMLALVGFVSFQLPALTHESAEFVFAEEEEAAHGGSLNETLAKEIFVSITNYSISPRLFQEQGNQYLHITEDLIPFPVLEADEQPPNC